MASAEFDVIVQSGDASPDGNGTLLTFTSPALGDGGQVAFLSTLIGTTGEGDNMGLFRGSTSGLTVILRRGDAISETETAMNFINNLPSINGGGLVSHSVAVATPAAEYLAFVGSGGPLDLLPRVGSASPSGDNELVGRSVPVLNNAGVTAYRANYVGMQAETGIYSRTADGTVTTRLLAGEVAPAGGLIASLSMSLPTLNNSAQIALTASIDDGVFNRNSVLRLDGTNVVELVRDGNLAVDGTTTIGTILSRAVLLNEVGQTAFVATYTQPAVSQRQGIFRADDAGGTLLTVNPLPESPFLTANMQVHGIDGAGDVAFSTDFGVGGDPVSAIYVAGDEGVNLIALEDGPTLPGSDKFFRSFDTRSISMNAAGQLAFLADLSDTADGTFSGRALYFYDPASGLQEIIRSGDSFAGSTVASLGLTGTNHTVTQPLSQMQSPDLNFSGLNNQGQVAFLFSLAGGVGGVAIWSSAVAEIVPGDYNGNGVVDAADYTVWRDHLGQTFTLSGEDPAATSPGEVDQEDYDFWVSRFGATSATGASATASANSSVPEPAAAGLCLAGLLLAAAVPARRRGRC